VKKTINQIFYILILAGYPLVAPSLFACDPNDPLPAALPPAPNGGMVSEAKPPMTEASEDDESPEGENDPKIYWEGLYNPDLKMIYLHLLTIQPQRTAIFTPLPTNENITNNLSIRIERPRKGTTRKVKFNVEDNIIAVPYDAKEDNRFIVQINTKLADQYLSSEIQIEVFE